MAKISLSRDIDANLSRAVFVELLGTLLFQFVGSLCTNPKAAAVTYTVLLYATQQKSGGFLNPAISLAKAVSGHLQWAKAIMFIISQFVGAILGAMLEAALVPGLHLGRNSGAAVPGCYFKSGVTNLELWGWETLMTFLLVYVVYAVAVAQPGHGSLGPLAIGLTLFVAESAGGQYTGASLNPARLMGPALVFLCTWKVFWVYLLGQIIGALAAAGVSSTFFGVGEIYRAHSTSSNGPEDILGGAAAREALLAREP